MTTQKTLKCNQCSKEFKYDSERKRHEQSHIPQFACKVCSKTFSFISALRRHEKQHERTGKVTCDLCDKAFKDHVLLKRHMKYAHEGLHDCAKCDSVFNSETALRTHMRTHKAESERRYQCGTDGCGKKFNFAHHLKHHELTHTNTKQYFCKVCDRGFIQSHHLKTHLKTHSADLSLHCTFADCSKKFATEYSRKRHLASHLAKTDSGISSDSNSAVDASTPKITKNMDANDCIQLQHQPLEAYITDLTLNSIPDHYNKYDNEHGKKSYSRNDDNDNAAPLLEMNQNTNKVYHNMSTLAEDSKFIKNIPEDLSMKSTSQSENAVKYSVTNSIDVNDCNSAVGGCIMSDESESCVCAQISGTADDSYYFTPIGTPTLKTTNEITNYNNCNLSQCCGGSCGISNDDRPEIALKEDGVVKIKEFMDINSTAVDLGLKNGKNNVNIPYNSCKAIFGNCIVSGNGTIGDGCLCAKMAIDDQVTAEEIDDITPLPNRRVAN